MVSSLQSELLSEKCVARKFPCNFIQQKCLGSLILFGMHNNWIVQLLGFLCGMESELIPHSEVCCWGISLWFHSTKWKLLLKCTQFIYLAQLSALPPTARQQLESGQNSVWPLLPPKFRPPTGSDRGDHKLSGPGSSCLAGGMGWEIPFLNLKTYWCGSVINLICSHDSKLQCGIYILYI